MCNTFNFRDYLWIRSSDKQKQTSFFGFPQYPHRLPLKRKQKRETQTAEVTPAQSSFQTLKETEQLISPLCPESNKPSELKAVPDNPKIWHILPQHRAYQPPQRWEGGLSIHNGCHNEGLEAIPSGKKKIVQVFYFWGGRKTSWKRRCPARPSQSKSRPADMTWCEFSQHADVCFQMFLLWK